MSLNVPQHNCLLDTLVAVERVERAGSNIIKVGGGGGVRILKFITFCQNALPLTSAPRHFVPECFAPRATYNLIFQKAFETVTPMNEEIKRTEFDGTFCKKFKLLVERLISFFCLTQKIGKENYPSKEK